MVPRTPSQRLARALGSVLLAGVLALLPVPTSDNSVLRSVVGAPSVSAQGPVDVGILGPSFAELPRAVDPGQTFTIVAATAPGARCSGQVTFRDHPPIDLEDVAAPGGTCSWNVTVPATVRSSTGIIVIPITRSGQWWTLYGITFVRTVGEARPG